MKKSFLESYLICENKDGVFHLCTSSSQVLGYSATRDIQEQLWTLASLLPLELTKLSNLGQYRYFNEKRSFKRYRDADVIFSKEMHTDIYRDDVHIIPNGIDIAKFNKNPKKSDIFTFIAVGVLREGKNYIALVDYAVKLKLLGYNFLIEIVGSGDDSGDESKNIADAIKKYDVGDVIKMVGASDDIPYHLSKADCFVMPSHYEGLPISLLEAGASKLPVISTLVGAIPTVIEDGCGYLATLDEFVDSMEYVLNNKDKAKLAGLNLYDLICEKYSIDSMTQRHEAIYTVLCSELGYEKNLIIEDSEK